MAAGRTNSAQNTRGGLLDCTCGHANPFELTNFFVLRTISELSGHSEHLREKAGSHFPRSDLSASTRIVGAAAQMYEKRKNCLLRRNLRVRDTQIAIVAYAKLPPALASSSSAPRCA